MDSKINYDAITKRKIKQPACEEVPVGAIVRVYNVLPSFNEGIATAYFWWDNQRYYCPIDWLEEI